MNDVIQSGIWYPEIAKFEFIPVEFSDGQYLEKGNHRPHTLEDIVVTDLIGVVNQINHEVNFRLSYGVHIGYIGLGIALHVKPPIITTDIVQIIGNVNCRFEYPTDQAMAKGSAHTIGQLSTVDGLIKIAGGKPGVTDKNRSIVIVDGSYILRPEPDDDEPPSEES